MILFVMQMYLHYLQRLKRLKILIMSIRREQKLENMNKTVIERSKQHQFNHYFINLHLFNCIFIDAIAWWVFESMKFKKNQENIVNDNFHGINKDESFFLYSLLLKIIHDELRSQLRLIDMNKDPIVYTYIVQMVYVCSIV